MGLMLRIGLILVASASLAPSEVWAGDDGSEFFETKVRPVLATHCVSCHGPKKQKAGLRLDSAEGLKQGGESGPVVSPGSPEKSRLVEAVTYHDADLQMPPKGKLADGEIEAITRWVKAGAVWPEAIKESMPTVEKSLAAPVGDRGFWSFQPVKKVEPPVVADAIWAKSPIDRFLRASMEQKGLTPARLADKPTLIRRATFDLTGLPPTPEEVDAFLKDESPEAFAKVVERLLASPAYGERWARHWLDLARYGEDQAHTFQARLFPQGYLYRDWVVKALNSDMPYDRFLIEQIAGDLLDGPNRNDRLAALGFFGLGASYYGGPSAAADERDDKIDTLGRTALGLTVACARCHDHKFDPISTADYYSLASIMASTVYKEYPLATADGAKIPEQLAQKETAKYVLGAWVLTNARKSDPSVKTAAIADREGLVAERLDRWVTYLYDRRAIDDRTHLSPWRKVLERDDPKVDLSQRPDERAKVHEVGQALQNYLKATLALRDALKVFESADQANAEGDKRSGDRPKLRDADLKAIKEIASNDGQFTVGRDVQKIESALDPTTKAAVKAKRVELETLKKSAPAKYPVIHAVADASSPTTLRVHLRGNPATLGDEAPRRFLSVLAGDRAPTYTKGSGRLELARAIASKDNPLTARVIVNRVWAHHFGRGVVATPSNFGAMGERPSHPDLLDWLAARFVDRGWSLKSLHREIMLTSAYAQSSQPSAKALDVDPENVALSHFGRRRLEVEAWRDAMLAVTGELDPTIGGASVDLSSSDNRRRTLYAKISRHRLDDLLRQFDFPDPNLTSDKRTVSTVPLQGLFVLNSDFMNRRAEALAVRLTKDTKESDEARIRRAFVRLYGRPAAEDEVAMGIEFLHSSASRGKEALSRWVEYAQVLLASNEFLFVD